MSENEESQWRVVKMKGGVPWPISLCKLEAGSSSTEIERRAWSRGKQLVSFSQESRCFQSRSRGKHQDSRENRTN